MQYPAMADICQMEASGLGGLPSCSCAGKYFLWPTRSAECLGIERLAAPTLTLRQICCEQAETGKHSRALGQELTHLKRLHLGEEDITQRLNRRCSLLSLIIYSLQIKCTFCNNLRILETGPHVLLERCY